MEAMVGWLIIIVALVLFGLLLSLPLRLVMALFGMPSKLLRWMIHFFAAIVVAGGLLLTIPLIAERWLGSGFH